MVKGERLLPFFVLSVGYFPALNFPPALDLRIVFIRIKANVLLEDVRFKRLACETPLIKIGAPSGYELSRKEGRQKGWPVQ